MVPRFRNGSTEFSYEKVLFVRMVAVDSELSRCQAIIEPPPRQNL